MATQITNYQRQSPGLIALTASAIIVIGLVVMVIEAARGLVIGVVPAMLAILVVRMFIAIALVALDMGILATACFKSNSKTRSARAVRVYNAYHDHGCYEAKTCSMSLGEWPTLLVLLPLLPL